MHRRKCFKVVHGSHKSMIQGRDGSAAFAYLLFVLAFEMYVCTLLFSCCNSLVNSCFFSVQSQGPQKPGSHCCSAWESVFAFFHVYNVVVQT